MRSQDTFKLTLVPKQWKRSWLETYPGFQDWIQSIEQY